jgi:hypothetical protein
MTSLGGIGVGVVLAAIALAFVLRPLFRPAPKPHVSRSPEALSDAAEAEIRRYRATSAVCPSCGVRPEPGARFCSSCGRALS